ncbi:MAG: hypothetical protein ACRDK7_03310 [Solirubrobacteraceae bacterium]
MTRRDDPFERLREANPIASTVEPDWPAVRARARTSEHEGRSRPVGAPAHGRRQRSRLAGTRRRPAGVLVGLALCAGVAMLAVFVLAPDGGSSDFLARAAAALKPLNGTVLYERWTTSIGAEAGNVDRRNARTFGPEQLWIEGAYPRRYRTILQPLSEPNTGQAGGAGLAYAYGVNLAYTGARFDFPDGHDDVPSELQTRLSGRPLELGGEVEWPGQGTHPGALQPTLTYLPPHRLLRPPGRLLRARLRVTLGPSLPGPHDQSIEDGADPAAVLRAAIAEGRAHGAGAATLAGRPVRRIDIELPQGPPADAPRLPPDHPTFHPEDFAYVEPASFHPVEIVYGQDTYKFLTYQYLPASTTNIALTSIRTQHPRAKILDMVYRPPRHPRS